MVICVKVYIITEEYDYDDDRNWEHGLLAAFSTLEAAKAWTAANLPAQWMHYDIQALEVDGPDVEWEMHSSPSCGRGV